MIRIYDQLGRIKGEIDPTRDDYLLHVSYVKEFPPYTYVPDDDPRQNLSDHAREFVARREIGERKP